MAREEGAGVAVGAHPQQQHVKHGLVVAGERLRVFKRPRAPRGYQADEQ